MSLSNRKAFIKGSKTVDRARHHYKLEIGFIGKQVACTDSYSLRGIMLICFEC